MTAESASAMKKRKISGARIGEYGGGHERQSAKRVSRWRNISGIGAYRSARRGFAELRGAGLAIILRANIVLSCGGHVTQTRQRHRRCLAHAAAYRQAWAWRVAWRRNIAGAHQSGVKPLASQHRRRSGENCGALKG